MTKAKSFKVAAASDRAELYCAQGCVAGVTSLVLDEPPIHIYESDCGGTFVFTFGIRLQVMTVLLHVLHNWSRTPPLPLVEVRRNGRVLCVVSLLQVTSL